MFSISLFSWLVRATLFLSAGWVFARWLETRSAAAAHRVLVIAFTGCALIPALMLWSPAWHWQYPSWLEMTPSPAAISAVLDSASENQTLKDVWPAERNGFVPTSPTEETVFQPIVGDPSSNADRGLADQADSTDSANNLLPAETPILDSAAVGSLEKPFVAEANWQWSNYLASAWLFIACVLMLRLLLSVVVLRRYINQCSVAPEALSQHVEELAQKLGVSRSLTVRLSSPDTMPMTCWLGQPTVVLPSNFNDWPEEHRAATLAHELGHLARRDALADYLVQFVACFMWVNPFVWRAAADVQRLRERACDQWALRRSGTTPRSYAQCLLAVVEGCHDRKLRGALPMAGRQDLESRLTVLMSASARQTLRPAITVAISLCLLTLGIAVATGQPVSALMDSESDDAPEVTLSAEPSPADPAINLSGTVVDEDGTALAGMNVVLRARAQGMNHYFSGLGHNHDVLAKTQTNAQGRFNLEKIGIPPRMIKVLSELRSGEGGAQLLVWGPGKAIVWEPVSAFDSPEKQIQLVNETKFVGTVLGPDGKPLDGAVLKVSGFTTNTTDIDSFFDAPGHVKMYQSECKIQTTTRDGEFSLSNMPADMRASIRILGPAGEVGSMVIDTGEGTFDKMRWRPRGKTDRKVHRSPAEVQLEQQPFAQIRIVDHAGNPVKSGGLTATGKLGGYETPVRKDGTATLTVEEPGLYTLLYTSDPLFPAIGVTKQIDVQTSPSEIVELKLPKPIYIEGKIVDGDSGTPVVGGYVSWGESVFDQGSADRPIIGATAVSGKNGVFRIPIIEGEHALRMTRKLDGYLIGPASPSKSGLFRISAEGADREVVVKTGRAMKIFGVVTNEGGQPQAGAKVRCELDERRAYEKLITVTDGTGRYEFAGLPPTSKFRVSTFSQDGTAHRNVPATPDQPMEKSLDKQVDLQVTRGTSLTGRVIQDGQPVAGVIVKLNNAPPQPPEQDWTRYRFLSESVTDQDGRYRLTGLHKGDKYEIEIEAIGNAEVRGWLYSSPYSHEMNEEDGSTAELPDAVLVSNGQQLKGIVVDVEGKPVAGYSVSASLAGPLGRNNISRSEHGPPPWTKTNEKGEFHLTYLPDEPIKLMCYKANPAGGRIEYPNVQNVKKNDMKIRIVIDQKLGSGIEDLD